VLAGSATTWFRWVSVDTNLFYLANRSLQVSPVEWLDDEFRIYNGALSAEAVAPITKMAQPRPMAQWAPSQIIPHDSPRRRSGEF